MTGIDERARRSRAHLFSGIAALVVAVVAVPAFGPGLLPEAPAHVET